MYLPKRTVPSGSSIFVPTSIHVIVSSYALVYLFGLFGVNILDVLGRDTGPYGVGRNDCFAKNDRACSYDGTLAHYGMIQNHRTHAYQSVVPDFGTVYGFNNVIVTLTNAQGQVISWGSAGKCGFRGSKKNTPYAAQMAAEDAAKTAFDAGLRKVKVYVKGPGAGRESAIRTINNAGIAVTEIIDVTPMPHNGCRPKGRRKV